MKFRLFTVSSGGSSVWNEDRLVSASNGVTVTNGLFSVKLGDVTPLYNTPFEGVTDMYFEIELPTPATATSSSPTWTEGPMSPRSQLATSAYAYNADMLDGLDSSDFISAYADNNFTGANTFYNDSTSALLIQDSLGSDTLFQADTINMSIGVGGAASLGRLHVTWLTGDTLPAIYGGSSSSSNDQVGVLGRSGSGAGLQGISGTGFGLQASSTSNIGVLGTSTSSIGVQGRSDTSTSGLFWSTNTAGTNSSTTLVTRASTAQVGDLFQAQDASNVSLFKINVNGSVQSKLTADSATGFVVQDAGGIALLTADSVNDRIYVGNTTADGTGVLLVLDTKNNAGDPTGVDGAMYYNSDAGKFRCYEAGAWGNCVNNNDKGYTIHVQAMSTTPADNTTVYFGTAPKTPVGASSSGTSKVFIRKAGTITMAEIYCYSSTTTPGSAEAWSLYIRKNNTTDTLISTLSVSAAERDFTNSSLSIPVAAGDYIEIKGVQPTWATNPITVTYGGYIYIE